MTRRSLWIVAALALMILVPIQPAHAQCTPLPLTVNGSSSVTLSPGSTLMIAGSISNCGTQTANIVGTLTITRNGMTLATYSNTYVVAAGQTKLVSTSFIVPNDPGVYVGTVTTSNGGSATVTVTVT